MTEKPHFGDKLKNFGRGPYSPDFWEKVEAAIQEEVSRYEALEKRLAPTHETLTKHFDL